VQLIRNYKNGDIGKSHLQYEFEVMEQPYGILNFHFGRKIFLNVTMYHKCTFGRWYFVGGLFERGYISI